MSSGSTSSLVPNPLRDSQAVVDKEKDDKKSKFSLKKKSKVRPNEFQISGPSHFRKEENPDGLPSSGGGSMGGDADVGGSKPGPSQSDVGVLEALKVAGKQSEILQEDDTDGANMRMAWKALNELVAYV